MNNFEWHSVTVTKESVEYQTNNQKYYLRLDHVDGAEVSFHDYKIMWLFALISFSTVFVEQARIAGIFATLLFVALYFATRKLTLKIYGGNMVIARVITGKDLSEAQKFIDNLKSIVATYRSQPYKDVA